MNGFPPNYDNPGIPGSANVPGTPAGFPPPAGPSQPRGPYGEPLTPRGNPAPKRWPWTLLGLLLGFLLGLVSCGGCVGVMVAAHGAFGYGSTSSSTYSPSDGPSYGRDYGHGYSYGYGSGNDGQNGSSSSSDDDASQYDEYTYSFQDVADTLDIGGPNISEGQCFTGVYTVGATGDIAPGIYYLEGSQTLPSNMYLFESVGNDAYELTSGQVYFGNYFVELDEGELIAFLPADATLAMHVASPDPTASEPPYTNGCYRVGIDIPAGTYVITADNVAFKELEPGLEAGAYLMKDLDFNEDSTIEGRNVIAGSRQIITIENGQYLELFAAQATPAN